MDNPRMQPCAICGEEGSAEQVWFLVAECHLGRQAEGSGVAR